MKRIELRRGEPGAPEVTFLHGFLGAPSQFEPIASRLPHLISVSAIELPGHSRSPELDAGTFEDVCESINAIFPPTRPRWLVGYSLGGRLALGAATHSPDFWRGVIAIGAHGGIEDDELRATKRREDLTRAALVRDQGMERFVAAWEHEPLFASQSEVAADALLAQRRMRISHTPEGIAWSLEHLGSGAMPVLDLARIRCRVRLVAGERDTRFVGMALRLAKQHGWLSPRIVAGAGHNVILESPKATLDIIQSEIADL